MKRIPGSWLRQLAAVLFVAAVQSVAGTSLALAQSGEALRPEIARPLQAAQELLGAQNYKDALARVREADAVPDPTPFEKFAIERLRGAAAVGAGDTATAVQSYEVVLAAGRLPPAEQLKTTEALVALYYRAKNYPKVVAWGGRYVREGGADPATRTKLIEAYYVTDDFAGAAKELLADAQGDVRAGRTPSAERLQLLASSYIQQKNDAGYLSALELLLAYYPKKEYWADAIRLVRARPGFSDRLTLDAFRLQQATGNIGTAAQYVAMGELALQSGYPAEAKAVVDQGFASGALGTGADADRQKRLRDTSAKQAAEDDRQFAQISRDAGAAKDGNALVNVGFAAVAAGQFDKGLALMEQGVKRGGLRRPDDASLHLAIAYAAAGRKAKAIEMFRTVQGADGTADLARLWLIHLQRAST